MVDEPMGLPKGTVRATITLLIIGTYCYAAFFTDRVVDLKDYQLLVTLVMGYYFGTRSGSK